MAHAFNSAEGDETLSGANIGQGHAWGETRRFKNPISIAFDFGLNDMAKRRIVGVAAVQQPFGPHISF
jgi:hypothetical protein